MNLICYRVTMGIFVKCACDDVTVEVGGDPSRTPHPLPLPLAGLAGK